MQVLPQALFLVMLELTVGSFVSLYLLDVRGGTTRGFLIFQGVLYLIFGILTLLAMNSFATPEIVRGTGLDGRWLSAQGPLVLLFVLSMLPWNVLLWRSKQSGAKGQGAPPPRVIAGLITCVIGILSLLVVGLAYRTLADSRLDGTFVVLAFLAGSMALGGVMTAMLLGHWYLTSPTMSIAPLSTANLCFASAAGSRLAVSATSLLVGWQSLSEVSLAGTPLMWLVLRWLAGIVAPLVLALMVWRILRYRNTQAATGVLFVGVIVTFIGELSATLVSRELHLPL